MAICWRWRTASRNMAPQTLLERVSLVFKVSMSSLGLLWSGCPSSGLAWEVWQSPGSLDAWKLEMESALWTCHCLSKNGVHLKSSGASYFIIMSSWNSIQFWIFFWGSIDLGTNAISLWHVSKTIKEALESSKKLLQGLLGQRILYGSIDFVGVSMSRVCPEMEHITACL